MEKVPENFSKLQIKSNSPPQSPRQEEDTEEFVGLTGGSRKKIKLKKSQKAPSSTVDERVLSSSAVVRHIASPTEEHNVNPNEGSAKEGIVLSDSGNKRKDDMDEEELGLGLGTSKSQRRKKSKSSKAEARKTKPDSTVKPYDSNKPAENLRPVHAPQAWLGRQREPCLSRSPSFPTGQPTDEVSTMRSSESWQGPWKLQRGEKPSWCDSSKQPVSRLEQPSPEIRPEPVPKAGPSNIGSYRKQQIEEVSEPILGLIPEKERTVSESSQSTTTCIFQIPARVLTRPVHFKSIKVIANYLEMEIKPILIYRYDFTVSPDKPKKFVAMAYSKVIEKYFPNIPIGFDQSKNLYSVTCLPGVCMESRKVYTLYLADLPNDDTTATNKVEVSFKFTGTVDLSTIFRYMKNGTSLNPPTEAIQAIDVILRQGTLQSYVKVGRQFFKRPKEAVDLGGGQEMWNGLFQSAIFTNRAYINIDVVHKGFPKHQLLVETLVKDFNLDPTRDINEQPGREREAFLHFIKNLKVVAYVGGDKSDGKLREFICNSLVEPPCKKRFKVGTEDMTMTVAEYFEKTKNCRIQYKNLNCMWVGSKSKSIYYPMEFLLVSKGQVTSKRLSDYQISRIVKTSSTLPSQRKKKIEEIISDMNYSKNIFFKKFGLDIANDFCSIPAKVLEPPKIEVGGAVVDTKNGVWNSKKLLKPISICRWAFIAVGSRYDKYDNFIEKLMDIASAMGMSMNRPILKNCDVGPTEVLQYLQRARDLNISIIVVALGTRYRDLYQRLKSTAERDVGVITQCVMENTVANKLGEAMIRNLLLKINAKLMGINHALAGRSIPQCLQQGKVMIVGADVTHPSPEQNVMPSIAAVTASMDSGYCIYNFALSVQISKKEMIIDFENLLLEHLTEFEKRNRVLPTKIFVFRDGVSDGQFAQVMNSELQAVHNAYARKTGPNGRRPEVLFLLVQKRHHTRFFLRDSPHNVSSGTVVDTKIVHPRELDFFLMSHNATKGTARPTRYHVVSNDSRLSQDEVEQLSYYLCHLYARCQQAVSYPAPTYYAHLACERARSLVFGIKYSVKELQKQPVRLRVLDRVLQQSTMFYI